MNRRRANLFAAPACVYALCGAFVTVWILEIEVHTGFTDAAAPFFLQALFFALPVALLVMWFAGRKGEFRRFDKLVAWLSIVPIVIPWGFACWVLLILLTWRGD